MFPFFVFRGFCCSSLPLRHFATPAYSRHSVTLFLVPATAATKCRHSRFFRLFMPLANGVPGLPASPIFSGRGGVQPAGYAIPGISGQTEVPPTLGEIMELYRLIFRDEMPSSYFQYGVELFLVVFVVTAVGTFSAGLIVRLLLPPLLESLLK